MCNFNFLLGENLDFLVETEKMKKVPETITEADDDILRIPYFSKTGNKVLKQSVNVTKVVKEKEENEKLSENFLSSSHKSRVKVTQHDLRSVQKNTLYKNKGTEVNIIFSYLRIIIIFNCNTILIEKNN